MERQIYTTYYFRGKVVRVNRAVHANTAVLSCTNHMQLNHYGATVAEIFDGRTGELHAVIKRPIVGELEILFKRPVVEGM